MHLWTLLSVVLAVLLLALAQDNDNNDSLMAALDAVSRRQRDLDNEEAGVNYYGLTPYRENADDVVYLSPDRDPNNDGQPENIGYGFQKSLSNKAVSPPYESQPDLDELSAVANDKLLEKLAIEYLENEFQNDNDANQYYRVGDEAKRSAFRERQFPDHYPSVVGKVSDGIKKRSEFGPTAFRERSHSDEDEETRRQLMQTIGRRMERERMMEEDEEGGYPLVEATFENNRFTHPKGINLESLTENEVEEILDYLGDGASDGVDYKLEKRYNGGPGYNFFNHGATMNGGFGFKKRSKQRLEETDAPDNSFLYSLKYVSPEYNREAVEQMRENDGIDVSGENDEDVLRLGMRPMSDVERRERERARWLAATQEDEEESPNLLPHEGHASKKSVGLQYHMPKELVVPLHHLQKKYPYDQILFKRKRMMMAKRSSDFYTSPPALHRHSGGEIRRKKDTSESHSTDPQVASELSHIFSTANQENTIKVVPQIIGNHVVTKQKVVTTTTPPPVTPRQNTTNIEVTVVVNQFVKKNDTPNEDDANDEEIELPVTMSRLEIPIEVKKKSIDWSDYFGLDRRRKKTGSMANVEGSRNRMLDDDSHMFNQYYKSGSAKKSSVFRGNKNDGNVLYKKSIHIVAQPFDTRIFDTERTQQSVTAKKKNVDTVDNMDTKLRNIEDLIVNEAVKYTGAHEGTTDTKEIQEVKDKVMSRLAAAYNLEKMRRALGEFKSSLAAQKLSKYNPEHRATKEDGDDDGLKKRVAFKKDKADKENVKVELKNDVEKKDFVDGVPEGNQDIGEDGMTDSMSEGYMGGARPHVYEQTEDECPILNNIVRNCHGIQERVGDNAMQFLPLCTLHQICYICGSDGGSSSSSSSSCDGLFLNRANQMCNGDVHCEKRALRTVMAVNHHQTNDMPDVDSKCWEKFCAAPLAINQPAWNHS